MKLFQPLSSKTVIKILLVLIVILAFLAGYYRTKSDLLTQKYAKLLERLDE